MSIDYPWPDPPSKEQFIARLRPASDDGVSEDLVVIEWVGERFSSIRPAARSEQHLAPEDPMVFATPGLFDVQINGYWGRGFKDVNLGPEGIRDLCWSIALSGSTSFLPTITTDALETMGAAMSNIAEACRAFPDVSAMVAGIHQEGPWISPVEGPRGAHALESVTGPDLAEFERLQRASQGLITMLTLAPEVEGAIDFIGEIAARGVVVCLGHHNADGAIIRRAVAAGARCVTHLGNGCHTMMPRHPNILWEQAAEDRLYAGIIADGHHLPPATVKVLYRAKPRGRLILVSDAISMAGAPAGLYQVGDAIAELTPEGRYGFYQSPILMGAAVPLARCLANLTRFVEGRETPAAYLQHVTQVPGTLMGLPGLTARLGEPNTPATFVVWRWQPGVPALVPQRIVIRGRTVYDKDVLPTRVPFGRTAEPIVLDPEA